jgi:hypothetical protein
MNFTGKYQYFLTIDMNNYEKYERYNKLNFNTLVVFSIVICYRYLNDQGGGNY